MFGKTILLFAYFEVYHYNSSFPTKNTTEYVWTQPGLSYRRIRRRILHLPITDTRAPHVIFFPLSSSPSIPTRPRPRRAAAAARRQPASSNSSTPIAREQQQQHAGSPQAAAAARIAEVVGGHRVLTELGVPVAEEGRRVVEEEERSTANSLVGPMTPGRVLVAAVVAQSGTWRWRRDSVRMEGGALGAD